MSAAEIGPALVRREGRVCRFRYLLHGGRRLVPRHELQSAAVS
jgi:hypothetical protein